ncbi:MAG: hypothetical protein RBR22_12910 [Desulfuromonas sp.]|nr:hypothetical protein [Desulfuromonas sp.]
MMNGSRILAVLVTLMVTLAIAPPAQADSCSQAIAVFNKSAAVQPFFQSAYGYAVFPLVGKGGFFLGGAYGRSSP